MRRRHPTGSPRRRSPFALVAWLRPTGIFYSPSFNALDSVAEREGGALGATGEALPQTGRKPVLLVRAHLTTRSDMWWSRKDRREIDALREEVARLRRANGELQRRLEGIDNVQQDEDGLCSHSMRSLGSDASTRPPALATRTRGSWVEEGPRTSVLPAHMRGILERSEGKDLGMWKEEDFMPLAHKLRHAPIPRVTYEAIVEEFATTKRVLRLDLEKPGETLFKVNPRAPAFLPAIHPQRLTPIALPQSMEAVTASDPLFAFWQTTKGEAVRIYKERNDVVSCVCRACVLAWPRSRRW